MAPALSHRLQTAELLEQLRDMVLNTSSRSSVGYQDDRYREDRRDTFRNGESYRVSLRSTMGETMALKMMRIARQRLCVG